MHYDNLQSLIENSSSSRHFFLSLPVKMQIELHEHNDYIHSAHQLHYLADSIQRQNDKLKKISVK